ncbi:MAG: sulfurtransferase [Bradymonadaceae bacterium]
MRRPSSIGVSLIALGVALVAGGCSESIKDPAGNKFEPAPDWTDNRPAEQKQLDPQPLNDEVFVDAERVEELATRDDKPATVIDARTRKAYEKGHFPGAIHSGNEAAGYKPFKDPEYHDILPRDVGQLQETARGMGVYNDRPVVIYASAGSKRAGRLHWVLEYLGHGEAYIYNPGYEKLLEETGVEAQTKVVEGNGDFVVRRRESVRATHDEVRRAATGEASNVVLIDTRRKSEFVGKEVRAPRHGYIPNAKYYHWKSVFDENDQLRPKDELRSEFKQAGLLEEGATLIPYCQTGTRSGFFYSVLRWVGSENAQNYDGSWTRWARLSDAPVAHDGKERLESSK